MKGIRVMSASIGLMMSFGGIAAAQSEPRVYSPQHSSANDDVPEVQVWLDDRSFISGDMIRPHVVADDDAYVTVFRVTTDGELKVLYPARPDMRETYSRDRVMNNLLPVNGNNAFYVAESAGNGFVFAVASYYRINYSYYASRGQSSLARLASANRFGTPCQIVRSFVEEISGGSTSYSMDYVM